MINLFNNVINYIFLFLKNNYLLFFLLSILMVMIIYYINKNRKKVIISKRKVGLIMFFVFIFNLLPVNITNVFASSAYTQITNTNYYSYDLYAYNVPTGATSVLFPTWNIALPQGDTLQWKSGTQVSTNIWKVHIDESDFKYYTGVYHTDVYYNDGTGNLQGIASGEYTIPDRVVSISNGTSYGYDATVNNVPTNVTSILFPTWTDYNGQDDLVWGLGNNLGNGTWTYHVNYSDHKNEYGIYYTHAYPQINGTNLPASSSTYTLTHNIVSMSAVADNTNNCANLNWSSSDTTQGYMYTVYRKLSTDTTYQPIQLTDNVRVLNVYPTWSSSSFTYIGGYPVSAILKYWMETQGYGKGMINITPVDLNSFNSNPDSYLKDSSGNYKYDVVVFGIADNNGGQDITPNALSSMKAYVNEHHGILFGHDTVITEKPNFADLASYVGITPNAQTGISDDMYNGNSSYSGAINYPYLSSIQITKEGLLTQYPYNLGINGSILTVPASHTLYQQANDDNSIWMKYINDIAPMTTWKITHPRSNFYLTSKNNVAMIQTGHSISLLSPIVETNIATTDEKKLLANTLFYLAQTTQATSYVDKSAQDRNSPNSVGGFAYVNSTSTLTFGASADNGTTYNYYTQALGKASNYSDDSSANIKSATITSGFKGYNYHFDTNSDTFITSTSISTSSLSVGSHTLYINAIDNAGNISTTTTYTFTVLPTTITPTITATADNVNNKVNTSWSANDSSQTYTYNVYRNGTLWLNNTTLTSSSDTVAKDTTAPSQISNVSVTKQGSSVNITYTPATDNGTTYTYYTKATGSLGTTGTSTTSTATVTTGISGYAYSIDTNPLGDPGNIVNTTGNSITQVLNDNTTYYLHVKTIDKAGNVSAINTTTIVIPLISTTLTANDGTSSSSVSWSTNDATQTYKYDLYRDGVLIQSNLSTNSYVDTGATDKAKPSNVVVSQVTDNINITPPTDNGTTYNYYTNSKGQSDSKVRTSNTDTALITSGVKGYNYHFDTNSDTFTTSTSISTTSLVAGSHTLYINAIDNAGNISATTTYTFTITPKAITPTITATADNVNNKVNASWSANDVSQTYTFDVYRNGALWLNDTTLTSSSDTVAKDTTAPSQISNVSVTKQGAKVNITYTSATDNGTTYTYYTQATGNLGATGTSTTSTATVTTGISGYAYSIDNNPLGDPGVIVNTTGNSITQVLNDNTTYYLHVKTIDKAGNVSTINTTTITIPAISTTLTASDGTSSSSVSWSTNDATQTYKYDLYRDGVLIQSNLSTNSYVDTGATDKAKPSNVVVSQVTDNINITPPTDNGTTYSYYTNSKGQIDGKTRTSNTDMALITSGVKGYNYHFDTNSDTFITSTSISISSLVVGSHTLYINAIDNAGNISATTTYTFTITPTTITPTITATADNVNNKVNTSWSANDSSQTYTYNVYRNGTLWLNNTTLTSSSDTVAKDTTAPSQISNVSVTKQGSSVNITYTSATDNGTTYTYYTQATGNLGATGTSTTSTATVTTGISGYAYSIDNNPLGDPGNIVNTTGNSITQVLNDNTTYYLHVKTIDKAGNVSTINTTTITIPAISTTLTANDGTSSSSVSWSTNDATQTYKYDLYRDGVLIQSNLSTNSYVDTGAVDKTKPSNISNVAVSQVMDYTLDYNKVNITITPPTDNGTTYSYYTNSKGQIDGKTRTSNTDTALITSGVKGYNYIIDNSATTVITDTTIKTTTPTFTINNLVEGTMYLHVIAIDNNGNYSGTYTKQITVNDLMQIKNLTLISQVKKPTSLVLPYSYPTVIPAPINAGYKLTFTVQTTSIDTLKMQFYINGTQVNVNNNAITDYIVTTGDRNLKTHTITVWFDKSTPKDSIIDIKFTGTKNRTDGTSRSIVENTIGLNAFKVVGSSLQDVYVNNTN